MNMAGSPRVSNWGYLVCPEASRSGFVVCIMNSLTRGTCATHLNHILLVTCAMQERVLWRHCLRKTSSLKPDPSFFTVNLKSAVP